EMVHAFQYDIFAHGKAGAGLQTLAQVNPPLWFAEGMAEYLSLGPNNALTNAWMRDAALNGKLPTIDQMTDYPERYFPYRYGHAFWTFVGQKWGDEAIGQIMNAAPTVGIDRAFKRELGLSLEDLGDEWKEDMQQRHLPQVANLDRPRKFATPLLTQRRSGGEIFLAPSLSPDGKRIGFSGSNGGLTDLYIVDVATSHLERLTNDRYGDLQPQWSPDGKMIAFASDRGDTCSFTYLRFPKWRITVLDLEKGLLTVLPAQGGLNINPQWSPDGRSLAYVSDRSGIANVFLYDFDSGEHYQLTNVVGSISAITEYSPAITWARKADRLAFTYYENGDYTIWSIANPRALKKLPYRDKA